MGGKNGTISKKKELIKLFEIAKLNFSRAILISMKIPVEKLDYEILIQFQESDDRDIRNVARELLNQH